MTPTNKSASILALGPMRSACVIAVVLAGCGRADVTAANHGIRQTGFPGEITAGGDTSGRVLARNAPAAPSVAPSSQAPQEGGRGQSPSGSVAGTPGIGEGSGGTTSGAEMGGTTPSAAATKSAAEPGGAVPSVPSQEHRK